jgi:CheY-like chemotaxis protein
VVENGAQAVEAVLKSLTSKKYHDLVLMDIQLPVLNGLEATQKIKALRPQLPVLAVSARALKEERELFLTNGMDEYIAKPVDFNKLDDLVARLTKDAQ